MCVKNYLSQWAFVSFNVNARTVFWDLACSNLAFAFRISKSRDCFSVWASHCRKMSPTMCSATAVESSVFSRSLGLTSLSVDRFNLILREIRLEANIMPQYSSFILFCCVENCSRWLMEVLGFSPILFGNLQKTLRFIHLYTRPLLWMETMDYFLN